MHQSPSGSDGRHKMSHMKMLIMIGYILGLCRDNGKENGETTGITGLSRGYVGIIGYILGLYRDNGKNIETIMMGYIRVYWGI